jgi:hypothetical protein
LLEFYRNPMPRKARIGAPMHFNQSSSNQFRVIEIS